jgi:methionine-rich copper-binding protein CopC
MNFTKMRRATLTLIGLLFALVAGLETVVVFAHADYDRSVPAADAKVASAPEQLQVWFTQELFRRQGENRLEVYAPDGERVDLDDAAIDDDNRRLMRVSLSADLPPGQYTVRWRSLSAEDGHPREGEFVFTVDPAVAEEVASAETPVAEATPVDTATPQPAITPSPLPAEPTPAPAQGGGLPCGGSTALIGLALGIVWMGRRRSKTF